MKEKESTQSKDFPKKLKELRTIKGWSQAPIGKKIRADLQRISKYEHGHVTGHGTDGGDRKGL